MVRESFRTERDFIVFLKKYGDMSEPTASAKLKYFKKCMYAASFGHSNPAYYQAPYDELNLLEELYCINELMYRFLTENDFLGFDTWIPENDASGTDRPSDNGVLAEAEKTTFNWNVPFVYVPFTCAYISSISTDPSTRTGITVTAFKTRLKESYTKMLHDSLEEYNPDIDEDKYLKRYDRIATYDLGIEYLSILEEMLNSFSRKDNDNDKFVIRDSVWNLTRMVLEVPKEYSRNVHRALAILLKSNQSSMSDVAGSNNENLDSLYPYYATIPTEILLDFSKPCIDFMTSDITDLLEYIETYLTDNYIKGAQYKISVANADDLITACDQKIAAFREDCSEGISSYTSSFKAECDKILKSKAGGMSLGDVNIESNINTFTEITNKYLQKILSELNSFLNNVKYCSDHYDDKNYHSDRKDQDFEVSKNQIEELIELYKDELFEKFDKQDPAILITVPGYISKIGYPVSYYFARDEIYRVIDTLYNSRKKNK